MPQQLEVDLSFLGAPGTDVVRDPGETAPKEPGPTSLHHLDDLGLLELAVGKAPAKRLLKAAGTLILLVQWTIPELVNRGGLSEPQARKLHAAFLLGTRGGTRKIFAPAVESAQQAAAIIRDKIGHDRRREHFAVLLLDVKSRLIRYVEISRGTLSATLVHPRDVLAAAVADHASTIIIAHNHPSGATEPSEEDKNLTRRLEEAARIVGIRLVDSLIVTAQGDYFSFAEHGMISFR